MARGSQVANVSSPAALSGLLHKVFVGDVKPNVNAESVTAQTITAAGPGQYRLEGEALVGAVDLTFSGGGQGTTGNLPDHQEIDAVTWQTTAAQRYIRRAISRFTAKRGQGPGSFEDFFGRMFDQMWDAYKRMVIRHVIGTSDGTLAKVSSRSSSTVFVVKDGYGHTNTSPLIHLEKGMKIAWVDVSASNAIAGAATISDINYSTNTVTVDSATTWEPSAQLAANDLIVMATTHNISTDYFESEFQNAPAGLMDIIDPDANSSTYNNISESTYPRWKPFREASSTFDHIELTEHWEKLRAKSTDAVGPQTHVCITSPAVRAELARSLMGFQMQQNLGQVLEGGYQTVRISGMDVAVDPYQLHDVWWTLSLQDLFRVDLDGDAAIMAEDGSQFSRLQDYDGLEWYVYDYVQYISDRRNRHAVLTGISLPNVTASDFDPTPNY